MAFSDGMGSGVCAAPVWPRGRWAVGLDGEPKAGELSRLRLSFVADWADMTAAGAAAEGAAGVEPLALYRHVDQAFSLV